MGGESATRWREANTERKGLVECNKTSSHMLECLDLPTGGDVCQGKTLQSPPLKLGSEIGRAVSSDGRLSRGYVCSAAEHKHDAHSVCYNLLRTSQFE